MAVEDDGVGAPDESGKGGEVAEGGGGRDDDGGGLHDPGQLLGQGVVEVDAGIGLGGRVVGPEALDGRDGGPLEPGIEAQAEVGATAEVAQHPPVDPNRRPIAHVVEPDAAQSHLLGVADVAFEAAEEGLVLRGGTCAHALFRCR